MKADKQKLQFKKYAVAITMALVPGALLIYFHENSNIQSLFISTIPQLQGNVGLAILLTGNIAIFLCFSIAHYLFKPSCQYCNTPFTINKINTVFQTKNCTNCGANVIPNKT